MNELNETKYKLAKLMQNKNEVKKLTQVWLRMMVDYWESKRLMEQTFGEYQQIVHGAYALKEEKTEQIQRTLSVDADKPVENQTQKEVRKVEESGDEEVKEDAESDDEAKMQAPIVP